MKRWAINCCNNLFKMVTGILFEFLTSIIIISLVNSIIIPGEYVRVRDQSQCNNNYEFKVSQQCEYNRQFLMIAKVWIGRADVHVNKYHSVNLLVDTGGSTTWVANYNTQVHKRLKDGTTTLINWRDFTRRPTLLYDFEEDNKDSPIRLTYADEERIEGTQYSNQVLVFRTQNTPRKLLINMSLSLAEHYYTESSSKPYSGILGLSLSRNLADTNVLLYQYEHVLGSKRMISFDIRWDHRRSMPLPSCFGIGQSVSSHSGPWVFLTADPFDSWKITVDYIEVTFPNTGGRYTENKIITVLDIGTNAIWLPHSLVNSFNDVEKEILMNGSAVYACHNITDMLPEIYIRFRSSDGRVLDFTFTQHQLYIVDKNRNYCASSVLASDSMSLGTAFFSRAYIEMHWYENHRGSVVFMSAKSY